MMMMLLFSVLGLFRTIEATYVIKDCEVINVDNDTVTAINNRQNEWKFNVDNDSKLVVGDSVDLVMDNNHADHTITDDEVKRVK